MIFKKATGNQTRMNVAFGGKMFLLLACAVFFAGCAGKSVQPVRNFSAQHVWDTFRATGAESVLRPFHMYSALYYTSSRRTNRTRLTLWGNPEYPVRLDLQAGMGSPLAYVQENATARLTVYPDSATAYIQHDPSRGWQAPGLSLPFSLHDLGLLVSGNISRLVPGEFANATVNATGGWIYSFHPDQRFATLILDADGVPVFVSGSSNSLEWSVDLVNDPDEDRPSKLTVLFSTGQKARLVIKDYTIREDSWDWKSMQLAVPDGVRLMTLP